MTRFSDLKITKQFAFFLALFSIVPLFCLVVFWFYHWQSVNEDIKADLVYLTLLNKNRVVQITDGFKTDLKDLEQSTDWQSGLGDFLVSKNQEVYSTILNSLESLASFKNSFNGLSVLDKNGFVVFSTDPELLEQKYQDFDWFFNTLIDPKILVRNPGVEDLSVILCAPFSLPGGGSGFIVADLKTETLFDLKENYETISETGELQLVVRDRMGNAQILFPPRFEVTKNRLLFFPEQTDSLYVRSLNEDSFFENNLDDYRENKVVTATRHLSEYDWGLILKVDRSEVFSPLVALAKSFGLVFFFLFAFGLVLTFYFYIFVTKPLALLAFKAEQVKDGKIKSFEPLDSKNEVGILSKSFSGLFQSLVALNSELEQKVTERTAALKKQFNELKKANAKDEALISSLGEGMVVVTPRGVVARVNQAVEEIFGWQEDLVVGTSFVSVYQLLTKDGHELLGEKNPVLNSLSKGKKISRADLFSKRSDGSLFPLSLTTSPIILANRIIGAVIIVRDITSEKEIDRMKSEFISIASHQLRAPIASIKWYGELLRKESPAFAKPVREFVNRINISTKQLIILVDDFLSVSRIESGEAVHSSEEIDPFNLVKKIIEIYQHEVDEKKLKVKFENSSKVKTIFIDPEIIRGVLTNLIDNAVKYTKDNGDILIRLFDDGVSLMVEVKDSGEGIPEAEKDRIFGKFFRASNVLMGGYKGTGLGLYTAKMLAKEVGGEITFESKEGHGSTFTARLPINLKTSKKQK